MLLTFLTASAGHLEHSARIILWFVAVFGSLTSTVFFGMVMVAIRRYRRASDGLRAEIESTPAILLPPVTILKPVHGMEPRWKRRWRAFSARIIPTSKSSSAPATATMKPWWWSRNCAPGIPRCAPQVVISGDPSWPNAKVFSLAKMIASSDNDYLVISDSDVLAGPDFLRNVMPPLLNPQGRTGDLFVSRYSSEWSLVATGGAGNVGGDARGRDGGRHGDGMKFALGAAMAVRRDAIEAIGGMRETADFYSDDFVLGNLVAEAGFQVVLSQYKVGHVLARAIAAPHLWRSVALDEEHSLLAAMGTRWLRPDLRHAVRPAGAAAGSRPPQSVFRCCAVGSGLAEPDLLSVMVGWGILRDPRSLWLCWLYPLRDLLGFCTWVVSFTGNRFFWRGEPYSNT